MSNLALFDLPQMKREICNNQILRHSLSIVCLKTSRAFLFRHSIYRIDRIEGIVIGMGNETLRSPTPTRISSPCNSVNSVNHVSENLSRLFVLDTVLTELTELGELA